MRLWLYHDHKPNNGYFGDLIAKHTGTGKPEEKPYDPVKRCTTFPNLNQNLIVNLWSLCKMETLLTQLKRLSF